MTRRDALRALEKAVDAGEWDQSNAWKVFGIGKTGRAERAYNGSLDAAKALHEALLPGWMWIVRATNEADFGSGRCAESCNGFANVWGGVCPNEGGEHFDVFAETPSRAFLLAVLKAYRAGL